MLKFLRGALCLCAAIVFMESNALARTYFIPDYQRNLVGKRVEGGGKDKNDRNCETYGYMSSCPAKKVGTGKHSIAGLTCYEKCICDKSYYKYNSSNCSGLHILAGESCSDKVLLNTGDKIDIGGNLGELKPFDPGTGALGSVSGTKTSATTGIASPGIAQSGIYYTACVCFPGHTLSVCPEGAFCTQCDGMYKFVNCQEGYTQSGKGSCVKQENCDAYPLTVCPAGGTCSKCPDNNAKLKLDSCDASKGWTKSGNNCVAAACPAGYTAGVATCSKGSYSQNGYSGGQICGKCTLSDECPTGYGKTACTSTQKETGRTTTEAGTTCYKCEAKDDTCPSGYQKSACSSAQKQTGSTTTEAGTTCYKCEAKDDTCPSGYQKSSCSASQKQTGTTTTEAGTTCYKCAAKDDTCPSGYQKSACSSTQTQTGSTTTEAGSTCYKCVTAGYQKVALSDPANSLFTYSGPNFMEDGINPEGKASCSISSSCFWDGTTSGTYWKGSMEANRNGPDLWSVSISGAVCYVDATKADGTIEKKTFSLSGFCSEVPNSYLEFFARGKVDAICKAQLEHFNKGKTAGSYIIPPGSDNVLLCDSMK